jgi:hypothetical protein
VSKQQAARTIGVGVATVDSWIARGLLSVQSVSGGEPRLSRNAVLAVAARVAELRRMGQTPRLVTAAVDQMLREDPRYQREFAELYGPGLAAMRGGDFVSAAPGPEFGPED